VSVTYPKGFRAAGVSGLKPSGRPDLALLVGDGPGSSLVLGCDLSSEYVRINGAYTT